MKLSSKSRQKLLKNIYFKYKKDDFLQKKDKIIHFRYIFYSFLAFFLGINIARGLFSGNLESILLVATIFSVFAIICIIKKIYKPFIILFSFFLIGNCFYFIGETSFNVKDYYGNVSVVGRVTDDITDYRYSKQVVLDEVRIEGERAGNVRLTISGGYKIEVGQYVAFEGLVERAKPFKLERFNSFDYRAGVKYYANADYKDMVITNGYVTVGESVRGAVREQLFENMSERNAGISYAVLFGDKGDVDSDIHSAYKNSGIVHLLSVSGLHVSFLISLIYFLLKLCRANIYVRFICTTIFILFYAYLCGFIPSVMRAGIMAVVYMASKMLRKRYDSITSLGIAGFLICIFSPLTALDYGFQMSFFSVAGVIMLTKPLTKILSKAIPYKVATLIALSLSAQIGIIPITANFGVTINILSIFANLIAVPLFGILYPFLFVSSVLCAIMPFMGFLLWVADFGFNVINALANFLGTSVGIFGLSNFGKTISAIYFLIFFALGKFLLKKSFFKFVCFCVGLLSITSVLAFYSIPLPKENVVGYVGYSWGGSVVVEEGDQCLVVGYNSNLTQYLTLRGIDEIDGFISMDYIKEETFNKLSNLKVKNIISVGGNGNEEYISLNANQSYAFGNFYITAIEQQEKMLGVKITCSEGDIFVASDEIFGYNNLNLNPNKNNIIFAGQNSGLAGGDYLCVSSANIKNASYSLAKDGNMMFDWAENGIWIRRID